MVGNVPQRHQHLHADFEDPASLRAAVTDIETVFLLTAPGAAVPVHDPAMIEAAVEAGCARS